MKSNIVDVTLDCKGGNPAHGEVSIVIDGHKVDVPVTAISVCVDGADQTASLYLKFENFSFKMKNAKLEPDEASAESPILNPNGD